VSSLSLAATMQVRQCQYPNLFNNIPHADQVHNYLQILLRNTPH
jgi:hypothetical protein